MKFIKNIVKDVLLISKATGTSNKKILIATSIVFSQLSGLTDIFLIGLFAFIIANQKTNILVLDNIYIFFEQNRYFILVLILFRFIFLFYQSYIVKKIEFTVTQNMKEYILSEIFEKKNYSTADAFFYTNELSIHIGFFYSKITTFLNSFLQILVFTIYLMYSNIQVLTLFGLGLLILYFPIKQLLKISRNLVDKSYFANKNSMNEIERIVDNLFLIKILKKENYELKRFSKTVKELNQLLLRNHIFNLLNGFLPTFLTMFILGLILVFFNSVVSLTLDFIGVTLKLFNSISGLTGSISGIINSHVHMVKFKELEIHKVNKLKNNFKVLNNDVIRFQNVKFKYQNSSIFIFDDINAEFQKGKHTIITGENGTGKSTILGLASGIFLPIEGTVSTFSKEYSYVSATPYIFRDTLLNNLIYGSEEKEYNEKDIIEKLSYLDTFKEENNYDLRKEISNKTLSSGQMQKIAFVRAILLKPKIILLDESTSNLDIETKTKIFNLLKEYKLTILNATHDPENFSFADHHIEIGIVDEKRLLNIIK